MKSSHVQQNPFPLTNQNTNVYLPCVYSHSCFFLTPPSVILSLVVVCARPCGIHITHEQLNIQPKTQRDPQANLGNYSSNSSLIFGILWQTAAFVVSQNFDVILFSLCRPLCFSCSLSPYTKSKNCLQVKDGVNCRTNFNFSYSLRYYGLVLLVA